MAGPAPPRVPSTQGAVASNRTSEDKRRQLEKEKRKKEEEKRRHEKERKEKDARSKEKNPLESRLRRETPFMCHIRFKNDLPELPCDPKMLVNPIQPDKLSEFFVTSIEAELKKDLILQPDLGIHVSLLDIERYQVPVDVPPMDPADAALLVEDEKTADARSGPASGGMRARTFARERKAGEELQPWLLRTTYISNEANARRAAASRSRTQEAHATDQESQMAMIEAAFEAADRPPVHRTNPSLRPVEVLPLLPDFDAWEHEYAHVTFPEADPIADARIFLDLTTAQRQQLLRRSVLFHPGQREALEDGLEHGEAVVMCVPTQPVPLDEEGQPSTSDRGVDVEELEGEYVRLKEYAVKRERDERYGTLLLRFGEHQVMYMDVAHRCVLRKHARMVAAGMPRRVNVRNRGLTLEEQHTRQKRLRRLEVGEAEEEVEDMVEEEL